MSRQKLTEPVLSWVTTLSANGFTSALTKQRLSNLPYGLKDDLESVANEALCQAGLRYPDYCAEHGFRLEEAESNFTGFAAMRIKGAFKDYLRTLQPGGRTKAGIAAWKTEKGASEAERAEAANVTIPKLRELEARNTQPDAVLPSVEAPVLERASENRSLEAFVSAVQSLSVRQREVIVGVFYLNRPMRDIAVECSLTENYGYRLRSSALKQIGQHLAEHCKAAL